VKLSIEKQKLVNFNENSLLGAFKRGPVAMSSTMPEPIALHFVCQKLANETSLEQTLTQQISRLEASWKRLVNQHKELSSRIAK
jgi:hypothetical protein